MTLFVETVKFMLGNGASAEIRPLTYRQRDRARKVARDTALELASSIDPKLLGSFRDNREAAEAATPTAQLTGDLDTLTVLEYGLVSIQTASGEVLKSEDSELLDRLTVQIAEKLAAEIYRISTLEDAENLSNG